MKENMKKLFSIVLTVLLAALSSYIGNAGANKTVDNQQAIAVAVAAGVVAGIQQAKAEQGLALPVAVTSSAK